MVGFVVKVKVRDPGPGGNPVPGPNIISPSVGCGGPSRVLESLA